MIRKGLIVLATIGVVTGLILFIGSEFGHQGPGFAFFTNWIVMSGVAMLGGVIQVASFLPTRYFSIKDWERTGRVYRMFGVQLFKRMLLRGPFSVLNSAIQYKGNRPSLTQLASKMCDAEAAHLLIFCIIIILVIYFALRGWWSSAGWLMVFNIVLNLYPIMLQRYNRGRLNRILKQ